MTRQRRWQIKQNEKGLCALCSEKKVVSIYCLKHAVNFREYQRKRQGNVRRNDSITYRLEKGTA